MKARARRRRQNGITRLTCCSVRAAENYTTWVSQSDAAGDVSEPTRADFQGLKPDQEYEVDWILTGGDAGGSLRSWAQETTKLKERK